jgi:O-acetyl-ADP-ribose deacetylase (regulator of RNase III)
MLIYVEGSLFLSPAHVLVNTVNTVGVMGKGIAKDFKFFFPEMFREYQNRCEDGSLDIGELFLFRTDTKWILNFPTKKHWRHPSKPEYIEAGLKKFVGGYARNGITSIAFPRLGCGNGELDWEKQVRPQMEKYLGKLPVEVFVHHHGLQSGAPEHLNIQETKKWLRTAPESLGFEEVWEDLVNLLHTKRTFTGLPTKAPFSAELVNEPEIGLLLANGGSFFVPKDSLLGAWQHLRSAGFISAASLVEGLDSHSDQVMAIFAELPYVRETRIAQFQIGRKREFQQALQFIPRPDANTTRADPHQAMPA